MTEPARLPVAARRHPAGPIAGRLVRLTGLVRLACFAAALAAVAPIARAQEAAPEASAAGSAAPATRPAKARVLVISLDGARPDVLMRAEMPTIRRLMNQGSFTMWATTTDIAITTPSHVSMFTGVTPERHGISFNGDPPPDAKINVPTLFELAKKQGLSTAISSGKRKFTIFGLTDAIDWQWLPKETVTKDDREVADHAAQIVRDHRPDLMLVHFPGADVSGHGVGWGTDEQVAKLEQIDEGIDRVLKAYLYAGMLRDTYVIVSADHGGTVRTHGRDDVRSRYIPWICVGPGVRENYDLTRLGKEYEVRTFDTFATACEVLKIPLPEGIDGKPVDPIFVDFDLMSVADKPARKKDPALAYGTEAPATSRPIWRGAGQAPTTLPAD